MIVRRKKRSSTSYKRAGAIDKKVINNAPQRAGGPAGMAIKGPQPQKANKIKGLRDYYYRQGG